MAERIAFGELTMAVHVDSDATGGAFAVLEELPPLADTPAHVHANEDEFFYAVEGDHVITVGDAEHRLRPGEGILAPRGIPHSQRRVVAGKGRILLVVAPGGLEGFFRRLGQAEAAGNLDAAAYAAASEEFGITWL